MVSSHSIFPYLTNYSQEFFFLFSFCFAEKVIDQICIGKNSVPVEVEIKLSELERFQGSRSPSNGKEEERWYSVRDLWKRETLGIVSFEGKVKLKLDVHGSVLFKFTPIGPDDHSQHRHLLVSEDFL
jgi:hypothetical protein